MATDTTPSYPQSRRNPRQIVNTLKKTVNFNDTGISTGVNLDEALPLGAFILSVMVEVVTAFNAGSTNTLTVGTNSSSFNNMVSASDGVGNGTSSLGTQVFEATRGRGRSIAASTEKVVTVKYAQTGGAATTGQAVIVITYEGGWSN